MIEGVRRRVWRWWKWERAEARWVFHTSETDRKIAAIQTAEDAESDGAGCGDVALEDDDVDGVPSVLDPVRQAWHKSFGMEHGRPKRPEHGGRLCSLRPMSAATPTPRRTTTTRRGVRGRGRG